MKGGMDQETAFQTLLGTLFLSSCACGPGETPRSNFPGWSETSIKTLQNWEQGRREPVNEVGLTPSHFENTRGNKGQPETGHPRHLRSANRAHSISGRSGAYEELTSEIKRSEELAERLEDLRRRLSRVSWQLRSGHWRVAPIYAGCGRSRR
jgi:hypothetical protein